MTDRRAVVAMVAAAFSTLACKAPERKAQPVRDAAPKVADAAPRPVDAAPRPEVESFEIAGDETAALARVSAIPVWTAA